MNFYLKYGKEKIKLANKPFAGGGEGNLYKILSPKAYKGYVAKIYHPLKRTDERAKKINYLYQYPPEGLHKDQHPAYIWVHDVLEDKEKKFMGFIMPFVKGEKLEVLCTPKLPKKLSTAWKRFDPRDKNAFGLRLKLCFNLAAAVYHVHSSGRYVIVDLKPENVVIQPNGLVSLVDMDSVEVVEQDRVIFQAPVATPEYTPAEHYTKKSRLHQDDAIDPSWDLFALATIFYKLLFGIHPFAASANPPYDQMVSLHQKIEHGLFVHHPEQDKIFNIIPPPHQQFERLNEELTELFIRSFVNGHLEPNNRPLAEEWCIALLNTFGTDKMKAHFQNLLLMRGGTSRGLRKPSSIVLIPKIKLKKEELLPKEFHTVLEWQPPQPKGLIPKKRIKIGQTIDNRVNILISGGISFIFYIILIGHVSSKDWVNHNLWEQTNMQAMFFVLALLSIPVFFLPLVISSFQDIFNPKIIRWKKAKKTLKTYFGQFQTALKKYSQTILELETSIKAQLPDFKQLENEIKKLQDNFQHWLETKDNEVLLLIEKEKEESALLLKPYVLRLEKELPFEIALEPEKPLDFSAIRMAIDTEHKKAIKKLEQTNFEKSLVNNHSEVQLFIEKEIKKIAWEKQQYLKDWEEYLALIKLQEEHDIKVLDQRLKDEADINQKYDHYLKNLSHKKKNVEKLINLGLKSILQIGRIDHLRAQLELQSGELLQLNQVTNATLSLASKLGDWFIAIRKLKKEHKDEKLRIERFYNQEKLNLKREKESQLQELEQKLNSINKEANQAYKHLKLQELNAQFKQYYMLLEKERRAYLEFLKSSTEKYRTQYEKLLEEVKAEEGLREEEIRKLEEAFKNKSLNQLKLEEIEKIRLDSLRQMKYIQYKAKEVQDAESNLLQFKS